jgi:hypothetical protein
MKKIKILSVLALSTLCGFSQHVANELIEYRPAPGQHINIANIGTPQSAQKMTKDSISLVSLGSFGGYVVLGFEKACVNHPDNPYGIDFTVFGNAFSGSSEPGVVWVMQDKNQNGLPDDTWYEIAGSNHFHSGTVKNYEATYFKTETRDVLWKDNSGEKGWVMANNFQLQEYYPTEETFAGYPQDSVTFKGTLLSTPVDLSNAQEITVPPPAFGYADSHPRKQNVDLSLPDNPYTNEIEGAGGDPIDLAWAVDREGNYVDLDSIHFVKIVSANLVSAGWLGEISTDVAWVETVQPNSGISGKENLLVVYPHPSKVLVGDSVQLKTAYFEKGRKTEASVVFSSKNAEVLEVNSVGLVAAKNIGKSEISVAVNNESETVSLNVVRPDSIQVLTDFSSVYSGDTLELSAQVFDNEREKLDVTVQFNSSNTAVGNLFQEDEKFYFVALQPGQVELYCSVEGFSAETSQTVKIHSPDDKIRVYFTLKTEDENLLPFQWLDVGLADLNDLVSGRQTDYSGLERHTLFHALAAGLEKAGVGFSFKDDDAAGGKLYLYQVENEGLFTHGWGGKTDQKGFDRAWIARLNSNQLLNNFDRTDISYGDTVALYHVPKITEPWIYSRLLPSSDSAVAGQEIEVQLSQTECTLSDGEILESDFIPVVNAEIIAESTFYTSEQGKAVFVLETEPPLVISSGTDAVLIEKKVTTGISKIADRVFQVYPNPVEDELFIEGFQSGFSNSEIKLFTPGGQIVFQKQFKAEINRINLSWLPSGIYILTVIQGEMGETYKIIKK